jgi:hypothetical protein
MRARREKAQMAAWKDGQTNSHRRQKNERSEIRMEKNFYNGGYLKKTVDSPAYQAELKKLQEHYGIRATLNSKSQAAWDKDGAFARLDPCNELWLRIEAAKDIIGAEFAFKVHELLAEGKTAERIIETLGSFEAYLRDEIYHEAATLLWGAKIINALKRTKKRWWRAYDKGNM